MTPVRPVRRAAVAVCLLLASAAVVAQQPPAAPSVDEKKARDAFVGGKFDDALKHLQDAAKANPLIVPKVAMARWFLESNQPQQARGLIERAATEDPSHPAILITNGGFALNDGRGTDALLNFEAALAATNSPRWGPDAKKAYQREARVGMLAVYNARRDVASARTHLVALLEADPQNPKFRVQLARVNFAMNLTDDAVAELAKARKDDPTIDPPELWLAKLWAERGDFPKAEEWFAKAAQAHPTAPAVHRGHASYLLDRGRPDAARPHLDAAQKLDPKATETKAIAGLLARYTKDYAGATAVFEEMVREHPNLAFGTANLAIVLSESADANQKRRAVELGEAYVRLNPRLPEAHAVLGYALFKSDRQADAERELLTAASLGELTTDAAYFLARVLDKGGKATDAHELLKKALAAQAPFVYRADAQTLFDDLGKRLPPKK